MAPHFASELWSRFVSAPNRLTQDSNEIDWDSDVLKQRWPEADLDYALNATVRVNNIDLVVYKYPRSQFDQLKPEEVIKRALQDDEIVSTIAGLNVTSTQFNLYPGCQALLQIFVDKPIKVKKDKKKKKRIEVVN